MSLTHAVMWQEPGFCVVRVTGLLPGIFVYRPVSGSRPS